MPIQTSHVLLTYSQVGDRLKADLFDFLKSNDKIKAFIIGEETHQDGGRHFHAYVDFGRRIRVEHATFDFGMLSVKFVFSCSFQLRQMVYTRICKL